MRDQLVKRIGMSRNRAKFLARDQAGSILGQMTAERHKAMGFSKFKWSTSNDEKVRDSRDKLEGQVFEMPTHQLVACQALIIIADV